MRMKKKRVFEFGWSFLVIVVIRVGFTVIEEFAEGIFWVSFFEALIVASVVSATLSFGDWLRGKGIRR